MLDSNHYGASNNLKLLQSIHFRDCYQEYFATFEVANHIIDRALRAQCDADEDTIMQQLGRFVQVLQHRSIV